MKDQLFRKVDLPSDEPVQFVGCYTLKWGKVDEPSVAFVEVDEEYVSKVKIRDIMLEIKEEIDRNSTSSNVGGNKYYRRLSELL